MNLWLKPDWDRGYEKGREAGIREAEARIIKLLEDPDTLQGWFTRSENYQSSHLLRYVADLIKGETE